MSDDFGGFTVQEFTEACRRRDVPSNAYLYTHAGSVTFLQRLHQHGLLEREGGRYYPTLDLCAALDVSPPLPRISLPAPREDDAHARASWRISLPGNRADDV